MKKKDIFKAIALLVAADTLAGSLGEKKVAHAFDGNASQNTGSSCSSTTGGGGSMSASFNYHTNTRYTFKVRLRSGGVTDLSSVSKINKGDVIYVEQDNTASWGVNPLSYSDAPEPPVIPVGTTCDCDCECEGDSGSSCFPKGTGIAMANGEKRKIEDVKIGDLVSTYDLAIKKKRTGKVVEIESPIREGVYILLLKERNELRITNDHPIYIKRGEYLGWAAIDIEAAKKENPELSLKKIEVGDCLLNENLQWEEIVSITYEEGSIQTYNLKEIEQYNNFFAGSFLVHNKGGCGGSCGDGCGGGCC